MPSHLSVLHVEQEVVGDETGATQSVLECDEVREGLLAEERSINAQLSGGTSTWVDTHSGRHEYQQKSHFCTNFFYVFFHNCFPILFFQFFFSQLLFQNFFSDFLVFLCVIIFVFTFVFVSVGEVS